MVLIIYRVKFVASEESKLKRTQTEGECRVELACVVAKRQKFYRYNDIAQCWYHAKVVVENMRIVLRFYVAAWILMHVLYTRYLIMFG
ncbi:Peptide-N(4)-(N-acetyl-beta-glucosaminyl)asparagine amidase [Lucilia cuprina]|nr:Peptide-N(4)-(N-acetyl-beta-glucosaminyl)asparagine amidase [Lucilia cuprina]